MTFPCLNCEKDDEHTNCGGLFCWECSEELSNDEKREALERHHSEKEAA